MNAYRVGDIDMKHMKSGNHMVLNISGPMIFEFLAALQFHPAGSCSTYHCHKDSTHNLISILYRHGHSIYSRSPRLLIFRVPSTAGTAPNQENTKVGLLRVLRQGQPLRPSCTSKIAIYTPPGQTSVIWSSSGHSLPTKFQLSKKKQLEILIECGF